MAEFVYAACLQRNFKLNCRPDHCDGLITVALAKEALLAQRKMAFLPIKFHCVRKCFMKLCL